MAADVNAISDFLQEQLVHRAMNSVTAVEVAQWLDRAGLLADSPDRPGLPLRKLLRTQKLRGQRQEPNGRWYIDRVDMGAGVYESERSPDVHTSTDPAVGTTPSRRLGGTSKRDEAYVIDLCDELLGQVALRQHRFDFLRGDAGHPLPVDAY